MMFAKIFLTYPFLCLLVHGGIIPRWSNGRQPTGIVDRGTPKSCNFWLNDVGPGEKCDDLLSQLGITEEEFLAWNPSLGKDCNQLDPGHSYCINGDYPRVNTEVPSPTIQPTPRVTPTSNTGPNPVQSGVTSACTSFHKVVQGDNCYNLSQRYGISLDDLRAWNPSIGTGCENLWLGYHVCVGVGPTTTRTTMITVTSSSTTTTAIQAPTATRVVPPPVQTGITDSCTQYYKAEKGDNCYKIANLKFKTFTPQQFIEWNPSVGAGCTRVYAGYYYCVSVTGKVSPPSTTSLPASPVPTEHVPNPLHPGTIASCRKFHLVKQTETCLSISQIYGISDAAFHKWNPHVGRDCLNLWAGYYICVQV